MNILHHITKSPNESNALACALHFAKDQDSLVLAGNAIEAMLQPQWIAALKICNVFLMRPDVDARGLAKCFANYQQIEYKDFIALTLTHAKVISW
ncbi:sulfurtransferase complex subunit TusB [Shewanella yunxiaonensis]|uniref:Sulfurtransferase complex subunit TusB n=1 Tax=Shewanella yunxiaonensis TaxID=2829809 RepID=A0ABX7YNN5_9GAMM|nr:MULTISPECIES: sulfurtransferase complex subunit TusB [Shewanella]MDF0535988.1 sulfurtransferase complex subunit TusB [Shewanella sp. A32]QUN04383.1 sulfurtransferase complex subunit TusB [Shewanella yunxiaonensis]